VKKIGQSLAQKFLLSAINLIPLQLRISILERLGRLLYVLDGRHRRIAQRNLALAFQDKDQKERDRIIRAVFRNLGRVLAELSFIPRFNQQNVNRYVCIEGLENLEQVLKKGRGVLFLTAHFGNWEWMAATFPVLSGRNCHVVVRPLDNGLFNGIVDRLRTWTGNQIIPKQKAMGRILRVLKEGGIVGVLLDQNMAWQEGVFVNFFGELACTNTGMALLALRTGAAVLPIFNIRQVDGRYRVVIEPELPLIRTGDKDQDVEKNTELFTQIIERYVREYPDHWLWLHQRWKTRPWQAKQYLNSKSEILNKFK
jgi:KDO2-lipid IV(A) lauroyltransferase